MKQGHINRAVFCCLAVLLIFQTAGCKKRTGNAELLAVTVNASRVYLDEAMYYIWQMEKESASYEKLYREKEKGDFWEQDAGDGRTVRDVVKQDVMDGIIRNEILYAKAEEEGYTLSDSDLEQCRQRAGEWLDELTQEQKKTTQLTEKLLTNIARKDLLVSRYFNDVTESFAIDREKLAASINRDEFRELSLETLAAYKEEKGARDRIEAARKEAKEAGGFRMLIEDDKSPLEYEEFSFIAGQDTCEPEIEKEALKLSDGEISGVVETADRYVILRMIDSRSDEGYEDAVESAYENEKFRTFDEFYDTLLKESSIAVNQEVWDTIQMGCTTIKE